MPYAVKCLAATVAVPNKSFSPLLKSSASNAGGVAVSGLEMSQNSVRQYASFATLDEQLKTIMKNIHDACATYGKQDNGCIDYKKGANIAGFSQIANAMVNYGIL